MRILITGSSGQIGTNLALRCLDDGHEVFGVDRRLNSWSDRVPTHIADLVTTNLAASVPNPPDVVVHLAANAKVHDSVCRPELAHENLAATHMVLEACRRWSVPLLFASSREVYGDIRSPITNETEAAFSAAASPYAASKIAGEAMIYAYARCYGLRHIVFRFSNVYGRFDNDLDRMQRVLPLFIHRIANGLAVTVYGADKRLDFTPVDDCVDGIARGLERLADGRIQDETINLAAGEGHSLVEAAHWIGEELGRLVRLDIQPVRTGEITRYVADLEKARSLLGYAPTTQLRDGIARAVAWNREWRNQPPLRCNRSSSGYVP